MLSVKILMDATMDNQQETKNIKTNKQTKQILFN
jgi:hypothetical protein